MPTYEKRAEDGTVLERTVTLPPDRDGTGYDKQMAALHADETSPWQLVDDFPPGAHSDPNPTLTSAPATGGVPTRTPELPSETGPESVLHNDSTDTPEV